MWLWEFHHSRRSDTINTWREIWRMKLNRDKTVCVTFSRKQTTASSCYDITNARQKTVSDYNYLGVHLNSSLSWHRHVDNTVANASKSFGFLSRNTHNFPRVTQELLFITNVIPIIKYACTVCDPTTRLDKNKLGEVQNLAARYVSGKSLKVRKFSATRSRQMLKWNKTGTPQSKAPSKVFQLYISLPDWHPTWNLPVFPILPIRGCRSQS